MAINLKNISYMARTTAKLYLDERWGGYVDIGRGRVQISNLGERITNSQGRGTYTLEMWLRLAAGTTATREQTLLTWGDLQVTYNGTRMQFLDRKTRQVTHVWYGANQWFQLAFSNGRIGTLGRESGDIYINGRLENSTMSFPTDADNFVIGDVPTRKERARQNMNYATGSSLGLIRLYNRSLERSEIENNYMSEARLYGLVMDTMTQPVSHGLILQLKARKGRVQHGYWRAESLTHTHAGKNITSIYKMSTELSELSNLISSLYKGATGQGQGKAQGTKGRVQNNELEGNIIVLSRNPEMFMNTLNKPTDNITTGLIRQTQGRPRGADYTSIFENPLKIKLLINYLQARPEHFLALLKSNVLTTEQLITLNNAMQTGGAILGPGSNTVEGFSDYIAVTPETLSNYSAALDLMRNKIQRFQGQPMRTAPPPDTGSFAPFLSELARSTGQIADLMGYQHHKAVAAERAAHVRKAQHDYMSTIRNLNAKIDNSMQRSQMLESLLREQHGLLGLIMSQRSGKCIGAIENTGQIRHNAEARRKGAQSPYNIMINPQTYSVNLAHILRQRKLIGAPVSQVMKEARSIGSRMQILGQCVNVQSKTVGLIVREEGANHYLPTQTSEPAPDIPILAIVSDGQHMPASGTQITKAKTERKSQGGDKGTGKDKEGRKGKTGQLGCPGGKCPLGYKAQPLDGAKDPKDLDKPWTADAKKPAAPVLNPAGVPVQTPAELAAKAPTIGGKVKALIPTFHNLT